MTDPEAAFRELVQLGQEIDAHADRYEFEIRAERQRQVDKHGDQSSLPDGTGLRGDRWTANHTRLKCDVAAREGNVTWRHILDEEVAEAYAESDPVKLRAELVQVEAVARAWREAIDRREAA